MSYDYRLIKAMLGAFRARNLFGQSVHGSRCVYCGIRATDRHHVVPGCRKANKLRPASPTQKVCGSSNTSGHHGMLHQGLLHTRWVDNRWEHLYTDEPTDDMEADSMDGWEPLPYYTFQEGI